MRYPIIIPSLLFSLCFSLQTVRTQTWKELLDSAQELASVGSYDSAIVLGTFALDKAENKFGSIDSSLGIVLYQIARFYHEKVDHPMTELTWRKCLAVWEKVPGSYHHVSHTMNALANVIWDQGRYEEAELLHKEVLASRKKSLGPDHIDVAKSIANLAGLYTETGRYPEAEKLFMESLRIRKKHLPSDDPSLRIILSNLAVLYDFQGKYAEAEAVNRQALALYEKAEGSQSVWTAMSMSNLAVAYLNQGRYDEAEQLLGQAVDTWGTSTHQFASQAITSLGRLHSYLGNYEQAESLYNDALRRLTEAYGHEHPIIAQTLNRLGNLYAKLRRYSEAESSYVRSLAIRKKYLGSDNPETAESLESFSRYHRSREDLRAAFQKATLAYEIWKKDFQVNCSVMSERDALTYFQFIRRSINGCLSCYVDMNSEETSVVNDISDIILSSKGQISDAIAERRESFIQEKDSATLELSESHRYVRFQISQLYVHGPGEGDPIQYKAKLDSLSRQAGELESELARRSASFRKIKDYQNVTTARLASLLPENSTLVEYLRYDYLQLQPDTTIAHYLVAKLDGKGDVCIVDLGEAENIDRLVDGYRRHFLAVAESKQPVSNRGQAEYTRIASELYGLVWKPIEKQIEAASTVFIAPDGGLNLISFAGLMNDKGQHLIEEHPIHYLSAGRDLIRLKDGVKSGSGLVAFGNPDYDAPVSVRLSREPEFVSNPAADSDPYAVRNVRSGCGTLSELTVQPLHHTGTEVQAVAKLWGNSYQSDPSVVYLGPAASEEHFKKNTSGHRVIHLATHGYFLQGKCEPEQPWRDAWSEPAFIGENPLLLSGLLLAGANLHGEGAEEARAEDGIVTALEISEMDLRGTELVVLSACETGLGEVKQGEGVYGLRRAFQLAGARTVVSSLWQVPDDETMRFMKQLYSQEAATYPELMQKVALRKIKELRLRGRPTHPYSWGAFVATGDWRIE